MSMKKIPGRGRPILEGEGGVILNLHITPDLMDAIKEKTKAEQVKDSKKKRADVIRTALRAYFFPPGKRRVSDPKREPVKE